MNPLISLDFMKSARCLDATAALHFFRLIPISSPKSSFTTLNFHSLFVCLFSHLSIYSLSLCHLIHLFCFFIYFLFFNSHSLFLSSLISPCSFFSFYNSVSYLFKLAACCMEYQLALIIVYNAASTFPPVGSIVP